MPPRARSNEKVVSWSVTSASTSAQRRALDRALSFELGPHVLAIPLLAVFAVLAIGLASGWWLTDRLLREDARFLASSTAQSLRELVPGLDAALATGRLDEEQRQRLQAANRERVLVLDLLDTAGRPIRGARISTSFDVSVPEPQDLPVLLAEASARREVAARIRAVEISGRSARVGEAIVPIERDGKVSGFLHLAIDLSDKVATYRLALVYAVSFAGALFTLAALVPAFWLWRQLRAVQAAAAEVRYLAFHDALTGLPNRLLFEDRLARAIARVRREGGLGALLMLDLDGLKSVNDALGHTAGDRLLQETAERLAKAIRATDTAARLGGDEFALVIAPLPGLDALDAVLDRLRAELDRPVPIDGRQLRPAATIGVALFPDDGQDPDTLVRRADGALYRGKAHGRGRVVWYREPARRDRPSFDRH